MDIFKFSDYREYLKAYILSLPKSGRGFAKKMAEELGVSPVIVSQVLSGDREFNQEQAIKLGPLLGLNSLELDYLLLLLQMQRAGSYELKNYYASKVQNLYKQSQEIKNRVSQKKELNDEAKAIYYSNWYYVAIRLLVCREDINTAEDLSQVLQIPLEQTRQALEFLESFQLIEKKENTLQWASAPTHISKDSPLVNRHHQNWRIQSIKRMEANDHLNNLYFTSPMITDEDTMKKVRQEILKLIEESQKSISASPSEKLYCLNIDLFSI